MRRLAGAWLLAPVCLLGPACSSKPFSAASSDAGAVQDGTTDVAPTDGASDAGLPDGFDPCDVNPPHTLCDTFDQSDTFGPWWSQQVQCNPVVVGAAEALTPPHDALAQLVDGGNTNCSMLQASFSMPDGGFAHCEFDVRYDEMPPSLFEFFVMSVTTPGNVYYQVSLEFQLASMLTPVDVAEVVDPADSGPSANRTPVPSPYLSAWHHVSFELDPQHNVARVGFDGSPLQMATLRYLQPILPVLGLQVFFGVTYQAQGSPTKIRVDDVWCDVP